MNLHARSSARDWHSGCRGGTLQVGEASGIPGTTSGLGFMATQPVAFPDDRQGLGDLEVVRQSFNTHDSSDGPQRRNKLRTNHNCLHDSEGIIGICAAVKVVLDFIRTAKLGDLPLPFWDGTEHLEIRAALELELSREKLYC